MHLFRRLGSKHTKNKIRFSNLNVWEKVVGSFCFPFLQCQLYVDFYCKWHYHVCVWGLTLSRMTLLDLCCTLKIHDVCLITYLGHSMRTQKKSEPKKGKKKISVSVSHLTQRKLNIQQSAPFALILPSVYKGETSCPNLVFGFCGWNWKFFLLVPPRRL